MPAPGDQYRDNAATVNPFVKQESYITNYTAQEIATLQSRLDKQLGPEYISTRPGNGGGKVPYLAADKVINLANEVFGFNGWSSSIQNVQVDYIDENSQNGRIALGIAATVRVTLKDGTYHEDVGYGSCENVKGKAAAFEKARKEAATDGMKRALRTFGKVLGNCLYDKDYLQRVAKVKVTASKWDAENLHRHPDYAPVKREPVIESEPKPGNPTVIRRNPSGQSAGSFASAEFDDDFGGNFLDETDFSHPDEVRLDDTTVETTGPMTANPSNVQRQGMSRTHSMPQAGAGNMQANSNGQQSSKPSAVPRPPQTAMQSGPRMMPPQTPGNPHRPQQSNPAENLKSSNSSTGFGTKSDPQDDANAVPKQLPPGVPDGFVTGRKADLLNQPPEARPSNASLAFNPHLESPSIRRTHGINPGKSVPITRQQIGGNSGDTVQQPAAPPAGGNTGSNTTTSNVNTNTKPSGPNFVNPSADPNRRIGMPHVGSPGGMQNRHGYRPPTALKRPALADMTNIQQADITPDAKKMKLEAAVVPAVATAGVQNPRAEQAATP